MILGQCLSISKISFTSFYKSFQPFRSGAAVLYSSDKKHFNQKNDVMIF